MVNGQAMTKAACASRPVTLDIFAQVDRMWRTVAARAFQIFEEQGRHPGRHPGRDLDDWLAAEHELLLSVPIEIIEKGDRLIVRAQIPGLKAEDLKVALEPERLLIKGRAQGSKQDKPNEDRAIFRTVDLPGGIELDSATATLTGTVLSIELTKAHASEDSHELTP